MLGLLNTYPLLVSEDLVFQSKQVSLQSSVSVMVSSLSGLDELTEENVAGAISAAADTGISRVLVTDGAGRVLCDTRETGGAVGSYVFYTEIIQALEGNDTFTCSFADGAFRSRAASPVLYHNQIIGAVYAYEYDTEQASLLLGFQKNLRSMSLVIGLLVLVLSLVLSRTLTRQISELLIAIRKVREGAYSHRAAVKGNDEIGQIAAEFNSLTDRLQTTKDARRRFVSDASHELKTPLAGIRLLTDSILQTGDMDADTTREFVGDIGREAERLTRITENLLRLTRLDSGAVQPVQPVAVQPVLERVARMLTILAREKGVTLTWEADPAAVALATEDDVHQILYNLMDNGIKYSGADGFVHTAASVDGDWVVLTVEDNGIGIPADDLPHIFERFYRVDKMRSRAIGGTGLGLSIVKDTVESRGGQITAAARQGASGTVFTVRLPRAKESPEEGGEPT